MPGFRSDLIYLEEGISVLEKYLQSTELFWNLSIPAPPGESALPALTLGGLLLSAARLQGWLAANQALPESSQIRVLATSLETVRSQWRSAWQEKARRSHQARLTQWGNFLEDYRLQPAAFAPRYSYEVRLRVMIHLLGLDLPSITAQSSVMLDRLDVILQVHLVSDSFIWESSLQSVFPVQTYPYLYARLSDRSSLRSEEE